MSTPARAPRDHLARTEREKKAGAPDSAAIEEQAAALQLIEELMAAEAWHPGRMVWSELLRHRGFWFRWSLLGTGWLALTSYGMVTPLGLLAFFLGALGLPIWLAGTLRASRDQFMEDEPLTVRSVLARSAAAGLRSVIAAAVVATACGIVFLPALFLTASGWPAFLAACLGSFWWLMTLSEMILHGHGVAPALIRGLTEGARLVIRTPLWILGWCLRFEARVMPRRAPGEARLPMAAALFALAPWVSLVVAWVGILVAIFALRGLGLDGSLAGLGGPLLGLLLLAGCSLGLTATLQVVGSYWTYQYMAALVERRQRVRLPAGEDADPRTATSAGA